MSFFISLQFKMEKKTFLIRLQMSEKLKIGLENTAKQTHSSTPQIYTIYFPFSWTHFFASIVVAHFKIAAQSTLFSLSTTSFPISFYFISFHFIAFSFSSSFAFSSLDVYVTGSRSDDVWNRIAFIVLIALIAYSKHQSINQPTTVCVCLCARSRAREIIFPLTNLML